MKNIIAHITGKGRAEYIANVLNNQYGAHGVAVEIQRGKYETSAPDSIADFEIMARCRASQVPMLKAFIVGFIAGQDWQQYHAEVE